MKKSAYIIIPTYNEKDSLPLLVKEILLVCDSIDEYHFRILIIDDNSPDGTGKIATQLSRENPKSVSVYHRESKQGLGSAYRFGFSKALQDRTDIIFEIDADLSHNPRVIPRFLEALKESDLVIGSRYVKGGRIVNWTFSRRVISQFGTLFASRFLHLPIRDVTSGFRAFRADKLRLIGIDSISSEGYAFQVDLVAEFAMKKLIVTEIPITFIERRSGSSKFSLEILLEAISRVFSLRKNIKN